MIQQNYDKSKLKNKIQESNCNEGKSNDKFREGDTKRKEQQ